MFKVILLSSLLLTTFNIYAQPSAPQLNTNTEGLTVSLQWASVDKAAGYTLFYAPFPFLGADSIDSVDMGKQTSFSIDLWRDAAFYVAIQAYDAKRESSDYSNVGFLFIQDRGEQYRDFWQKTSKEIAQKSFVSDDFLYAQLPDISNCSAGKLNTAAKLRSLDTLNATRQLHNLALLTQSDDADEEVQQASLIQKANNFLSHTPANSANCYSQVGYDGSSSSNLHLASSNGDPADDIIGLIDDSSNVSNIAGAGHRRAFLNPFLPFSSYGQVYGASAAKVFDFSTSPSLDSRKIPDFVAFPYLRYPYVFFSDKSHNKITPWNFTLIEDKTSLWGNQHAYFANSILTVQQKDTGQLLDIADLYTDTKASGVPNTLSWTVGNWEYDTWYNVTIDNILYQSGEVGRIEYDVYIDYKNIIDITEPLESADQQSDQLIQGTLFNDGDSDSYEVKLKGHTRFTGSSQFSNMAFFIAVYDMNKQLIAVNDQSFSLELTEGVYTVVISNCGQNVCYTQSKDYSVQM
ncbi:MAG: hypothetical protein GQ582_05120 [Methyloprofundus sp.]|nr:hypothetical protein [Methyloprofundus sp.]